MNILKLYHARWKQEVFDENGYNYKNRIIEYYVLYERINHITHQKVNNQNGLRTIIGHNDSIDNLLFDSINKVLLKIPNIIDFDSFVHEYRPWNEFELIERAWASKRAIGKDFNNLDIYINSKKVSLASRIRSMDYENVKKSIIFNIPKSINLNIDGQNTTLISAKFYSCFETDKIIKDYWEGI